MEWTALDFRNNALKLQNKLLKKHTQQDIIYNGSLDVANIVMELDHSMFPSVLCMFFLTSFLFYFLIFLVAEAGMLFEFFYIMFGKLTKGNIQNNLDTIDQAAILTKLSSRFIAHLRELFNSASQKKNYLMKRHTLILEKMNVPTQVINSIVVI